MKARFILFLLAAFVLFAPQVMAQTVPEGINYQAVARSGNSLLANQTFVVRYTLFEGGTLRYQETQSVTTNQFGVFASVVGKGQVVVGTFASLNWSSGDWYLQVELDNGNGFINLGSNRLQSVPFAQYAKEAETVSNFAVDDLSDVIAPLPDSGDVLKFDGTQWITTPDAGNSVIAGNGLAFSNDTLINTGDPDPNDDIVIGSLADGDLSGTYPDPTVDGIQGNPVSANAPSLGYVFKWNGTEWAPSPDNVTTGGGVNVTARLVGDGSTGGGELDLAQQGASVGQVLKWNGASWSPAPDDNAGSQTLTLTGNILTIGPNGNSVNLPVSTYVAGTGILIQGGNTIVNTGDTDPFDDVKIGDPAGGDLFGPMPSPIVTGIRGVSVSATASGVQTGQILKFNNGQWEPSTDLVNDADADPTNEIQVLTQPNSTTIQLSKGGGTATIPTYTSGPGINITGFTINNTGDLNGTDDVLIGSAVPGGDLTGTYPAPTVGKLQGITLAAVSPSPGQVLKFQNGEWQPGANEDNDSNPTNEIQSLILNGSVLGLTGTGNTVTLPSPPTYLAGTGINITGVTITNTGDTNPNDDLLLSTQFAGDVTGTYNSLVVGRLQGRPVSTTQPQVGQTLKWNGFQWTPANDEIDDLDTDPQNELQGITQSGNVLTLSKNGGSTTLFTAGTGIQVNGNVISNTGDLDPGDDVLINSPAGGDLGGTYPNPSVERIKGVTVAGITPTFGQVLKFIGGQWVPTQDDFEDADSDPSNEFQNISQVGNQLSLSDGGGTVTLYQAGTGIQVSGNTITNVGDLDPNDDILKGSAAGGDLGGTYPDPIVNQIKGVPVAGITPSFGQVLKFIGGQWVPTQDDFEDADSDPSNEFQSISQVGNQLSLSDGGGTVTLYQAGAGIDVAGNVIINTGDLDGNDDVNLNSPATGDLSGTYPAPTVAAIQNQPVSSQNPTAGQVLKFVGGQWIPAADLIDDADANPSNELQTVTQNGNQFTLNQGGGTITMYQPGTGIAVSGNTISNTGDLDPNNDVLVTDNAGGDVSGTFSNLTVTGLQGNAVSVTNPTINGQVLKWNSTTTQWEPGTDIFDDADNDPVNEFQTISQTGVDLTLSDGGGTIELVQAGTGIAISGNIISNTGDLDPNNDVLVTDIAGGDVTGTFDNLSVVKLQGNNVSATPPVVNGEVLKWNANTNQWEPGVDGNTTYTPGTGISFTGTIINNTGDLDPLDDVLITDNAGGDISGVFSNMTVENIQGSPVTNTPPTATGQILQWDNTAGQWVLDQDDINDADADPTNEFQTISQLNNELTLSDGGGTVTLFQAGTGIDVTGNVITNTGDLDGNDDINTGDAALGDLSGTYPAPTVAAIQNQPVASTVPTAGQALKFVGGQWVPATDEVNDADADVTNELQTVSQSGVDLTLSDGGGTVTLVQPGTGISITGNTIANTGDTNAADDVTLTTAASGDVSGDFATGLTVEGLQTTPVSATAPTTNGQVLKWNSTSGEWEPGTDGGETYTAGAGIDVTGTVITNTGDLSTTNELQTISQTANQLTLSDGGGTVTLYQAGAGILVSGNTIINDGDTAGGDLTGTYPSPTVAAIQGQPVASVVPTANQTLKFIGGQWIPATDEVDDADADATNELQTVSQSGVDLTLSDGGGTVTLVQPGTGISITGNTIANTGDTNGADDVTLTTAASGDVSGDFATGLTVEGLQTTPVSTTAPSTNGQVLKWNSTSGEWEPGTDGGETYTAGAGIDVTGTVITNTGDLSVTNELQTVSQSGVDLTLSDGGGTITLVQAGAGVLISGNTIINTGDTDPANDVEIGDAAGGDLSGTYPSPTVAAIQGQPVASVVPTANQTLKFIGGQWIPATDEVDDADADATNELQTVSQSGVDLTLSDGGGTVTLVQPGTGISITGNTIANTGDTNGADDVTLTTSASGDVSGDFTTGLTVEGLQTTPVSATAPTVNGQVLKWNSTSGEWEPGNDDGTTYTGAAGIDVTGTVITNTGDLSATNELQTVSQTGVDLTLSDGGGTVTLVQPGTGISITGNTIANTGDTNASDDVTLTTGASGDVSGDFTAGLTVEGLQTTPVSATAPSVDGQVLKWNSTSGEWEPGNDDGTTYTGAAGIDVTGTVITNTGDTNAADDVTLTTGASGDVSGDFTAGLTVEGLQTTPVSTTAPTINGQVLKWNSTSGEWEPGTDDGNSYTGAAGIDVTGTVITNTGDLSTTNELQTVSQSGVDLTLSDGGGTVTLVQPGTGILISGNTIINSGDTDPADDIEIGDAATGDLSGTYPAPTVAAIQGEPVSSTTPTSAQVLKYTAGQWVPSADAVDDADADITNELQSISQSGVDLTLSNSGGTVTLVQPGTGITITGNTIANAGDTNAADDVTLTTAASGDVSGDFTTGLVVEGIQNTPVSATAPSVNGQVLKWNSTSGEWEPGTDDGSNYTGGAGIDVLGTVITNTGDRDSTNDVLLTTAATGDVSGDFTAGLTVTAIQGVDVSTNVPTVDGQALKWNATTMEWEPGTDNINDADADATNELQTVSQVGNQLTLSDGGGTVTLFTAGTGIDVTSNVISNTGDTNGADDIKIGDNATGDLDGTFPSPTVVGIQGVPVANLTPINKQVLKYNNGQWFSAADSVDDADADASNELQTLSQSGVDVTLSNGGGTLTVVQAGSGISLSGNTIVNDGDINGSDDVLITDNAGGDADGTFDNLTVVGLQGQTVSTIAPTFTGQVLKWNATTSEWEPGTDAGIAYTAGPGISIVGTLISNSGDLNPADDLTTGTIFGGDVTGVYTNIGVTAIQGNAISTAAPTADGQVLKWNATAGEWEPGSNEDGDADDTNELQTLSQSGIDLTLSDGGGTVTLVQAGTGISFTGNTIINTGDTDGGDDVDTTSTAGGDVSGTFSTLTVEKIQGNTVAASIPTITGQVLKWDNLNSQWDLGVDNNTTYTAGTGITINGSNQISNSGDINGTDDVLLTTAATGDVTGDFTAGLNVVALQGSNVSTTAPTTAGQVLVWSTVSSEWEPGTDANTEYTAGPGIVINGSNEVINTGDRDSTNDVLLTTTATGDVSGDFTAGLNVVALQGNDLSATAPTTTGQVLVWDNTAAEWQAGTDANTEYVAGPGIVINGSNQVINTGDRDSTNDVLLTTAATGDVTGDFTAGLNVVAIQGNDVSATAPTTTGQVLVWDNTALEWQAGTDVNTIYAAGAGITIDGSNNVINTGDRDSTNDVLLTTAATGDVTGDFTAGLNVVALQGSDVSATAPTTTGQVLVWDNTALEWQAGTDANTIYAAGAGITIDGSNNVINTGDRDSTNDVLLTTAATGDVTGDFTAGLNVVALQGSAVSTTAPTTTGQVLVWDNTASEWQAGTDANTTYAAGAGITIDGSNNVINTGDRDSTNDVLLTTAATGDIAGDFTAGLDVVGIQGQTVASTTPDTDEFFRFDGTDWVPDSINVAEVTVDGSWIPTTTDVYDLGSSTLKWNDIWAVNSTIQTSDIRAKEQITALDYGLSEIMALRPVSYTWIQHPEQGRKLGLIAQEVEEVVSEAVRTHSTKIDPQTGEIVSEELDLYGMSYTDLIPVMINAMQEQQGQLDQQQSLIETQAELIERLESRIEALEQR